MTKPPETNASQMSQQDLVNMILHLDPSRMRALEETIRRVRQEKFGSEVYETRSEDGARAYGSMYGRPSPLSSPNSTTTSYPRRKGKTYEEGRRNLKAERVTREEAERRARRRERNRIAAARCRGRRQTVIDALQDSVNNLKEDGRTLRENLRQLEKERKALNNLLENHNCILPSTDFGDMECLEEDDSRIESVKKEQPESIEYESIPPPPPMTCRPSSFPLPLTTNTGASMTRISPLLTPTTISLLDSQSGIFNNDSITSGVDSFQSSSFGYLNMLSPSLEMSQLNFLATPTSSTGPTLP